MNDAVKKVVMVVCEASDETTIVDEDGHEIAVEECPSEGFKTLEEANKYDDELIVKHGVTHVKVFCPFPGCFSKRPTKDGCDGDVEMNSEEFTVDFWRNELHHCSDFNTLPAKYMKGDVKRAGEDDEAIVILRMNSGTTHGEYPEDVEPIAVLRASEETDKGVEDLITNLEHHAEMAGLEYTYHIDVIKFTTVAALYASERESIEQNGTL